MRVSVTNKQHFRKILRIEKAVWLDLHDTKKKGKFLENLPYSSNIKASCVILSNVYSISVLIHVMVDVVRVCAEPGRMGSGKRWQVMEA